MKTTDIKDVVGKTGQEIELYGWVNTKRDHKKIVFLDLRDRTGLVQVVGGEEFKELSLEDVVMIKGLVKARPEKLINPKIPTGTVEVEAQSFRILGKSKPLPLPVNTDGYEIDEEIRMKYRYLDLRRPRIAKNLALRSRFIQLIREYLFRKDFLEVETPVLSETTPEGARDFIVPSRLQKGKFYALPQSPQQYKQLLMVAGIEKYFQIARCFRDEDPRADRAYGEFTQLDMELSFVEREDVMALTEGMIIDVYEKLGVPIRQKPFPVITYKEALAKYGADKFDMRTEEEKKNNIQAFAWVVDFPFFEKTDEGGWTFTHNPFSAPLPQYKEQLLAKKDVGSILTTQYDLVCNGYEVGGGSIRSHEPDVLKTVFEIMGYSDRDIQAQFGHMLEAFSYGAPPHGGIAPGLDRLLTCITGEPSLRDVIAFPMTSGGKTAVMSAPSAIPPDKLTELGIMVNPAFEKKESVYETIVDMLKRGKVAFKTMEHEAVMTSEEASKVRGTELKQGAKALLMYADSKPVMLVVPADRKVDMKKFKNAQNVKDLRMATKEEVKKVTGVEIGAVPPFGTIFNIPLYADRALEENTDVVFNAGDRSKSILLKCKDYLRVSEAKIEEFSV